MRTKTRVLWRRDEGKFVQFANTSTVPIHTLTLQTMSNSTAKGESGKGPSRSLYVSNLSPSVTEYDIVALFSPHGKISRLDLIFHKSGPLKGKTKGYAFVEFSKQEDAIEAKVRVDGRLIGGRKISVGWAVSLLRSNDNLGIDADLDIHTYAQNENTNGTTGPIRTSSGRSHHSSHQDELKPTTLSLMKNSQRIKGGTNAKIAAMEAKLAALRNGEQRATDKDDASNHQTDSPRSSSSSSSSALKKAPANAGLPRKPPPPCP